MPGAGLSIVAIVHDFAKRYIKQLDCGCGAPVGVYAQINGSTLSLYGMIAQDNIIKRGETSGNRKDASKLGTELAQKMISTESLTE